MQTYIYPSITWTTFNNEYGTGTLNAAYTIIRYGGKNGSWLGNRIGVQTGINDYTTAQNSFDELYYSYQLGGKWNWLTLGLGQFPLYNFDGSAYAANQQVNFINYALSQTARQLILPPGSACMRKLRRMKTGLSFSADKTLPISTAPAFN